MLDANRLVGLLADPSRRRVVAALVLGSSTVEQIGVASGLDARTVGAALARLVEAGLVERGADGTHLVLEEAFSMAARAGAPAPRTSAHPDAAPDVAQVLDSAFRDGRLVRLPAKQSKRLVVLDHIAQRFEPGRRYTERQINAEISTIHTDTATIRRYLVDHGFMDREGGEYWRSGGSVT